MTSPNRSLPASSMCKRIALLTLILLLVGAPVVNAQDNVNGLNGNAGTTNTPVSRNANAGTGTTANGNLTQNASGNGNVIGNVNQRGSGATPAQTQTPTQTPVPTQTPAPELSAEGRKNKLVDSYWFYPLVSLMFLGVLFPFGYAIYRSIKYSRGTYGPLGLPEGSLRAMLAYMLVAFLGFYVLAGTLSLSEFKPSEFLLGVVATVVGFYFGSRTGEGRGADSASSRTGDVEGEVTDKADSPAAGATVTLSQVGVTKHTQTADLSGKYKFDDVPVGVYDIQASLAGNAPSDQAKVKVVAGAPQNVKLKLK